MAYLMGLDLMADDFENTDSMEDEDGDEMLKYLYFGDYEDYDDTRLPLKSSGASSSTDDLHFSNAPEPTSTSVSSGDVSEFSNIADPVYIEIARLSSVFPTEGEDEDETATKPEADAQSDNAIKIPTGKSRPGRRRRDRIKRILNTNSGYALIDRSLCDRTERYYRKINRSVPWKVKARGVSSDQSAAFAHGVECLPHSVRVDSLVSTWKDCSASSLTSDWYTASSSTCVAATSMTDKVSTSIRLLTTNNTGLNTTELAAR
eukprot:TRINITY_DN77644_c0_g1_i1.p1 TRINITY_DN77644_c0_g1~~TRINITY_DN77644_c0_g1_i1.p1  ORF type:complete len:261 (+),score=1.08 TRINITY_DN77644_c0_g1_i1:62-844(+)